MVKHIARDDEYELSLIVSSHPERVIHQYVSELRRLGLDVVDPEEATREDGPPYWRASFSFGAGHGSVVMAGGSEGSVGSLTVPSA